MQFAGLHVFPYSARPGTNAAYLQPRVDDREKRLRMESMLSLAKEQAQSYRRKLLGTTCGVLWETGRPVAGGKVWSGLTDNYVRVATPSRRPLHNRITPAVLERQQGDLVWARVV